MSEPAHVLVVAHQTAATPGLIEAVRELIEQWRSDLAAGHSAGLVLEGPA